MMLNPADQSFQNSLAALLPDGVLRIADSRYLEEPRGRVSTPAGLVALPHDTQQVATIVRHAAQHKVAIVPFGGGTGLVVGQVAPNLPAPLILSLEKLNKVRAIHPQENTMIVEAGVILSDVQDAAESAGRLFPLSLAAEGSATIGGNLATNAGGTAVLRYGTARELCLGLEAVMPNGEIWNGLTRLRKDNTGYDLRHLLIGAEGTLGVITAACLRLYSRPVHSGTAMLVVKDPTAALDLLSLAQKQTGDAITAFELMHRQGLDFLFQHLPDVRLPFHASPEWSVLIELGGGATFDPSSALEAIFEQGMEQGLISDGLIAQSQGQSDDFWRVREMIPQANRLVGAVSNHDISLPLSAVADFVAKGSEVIGALGDFRINCFGHVGDGNLHYNVFPTAGKTRADYAGQAQEIKRVVHDLVHEMGGSFSAEHGVGRLKVADLERYGDPAGLVAMRAIKAALDPAGIMNPGAVLCS